MTVVPARVAGVDADRRRVPGRTATAPSTRSCSAPPGSSRSTPFLVAGGAQAIGALAFGLPDDRPRAGRPDRRPGQRLGHRRQARGRRRRRRSTCPPARPRGSSSPTPTADPVRRRRPHHAGGARPRLARHPRHDRRGARRRRRGRRSTAASPRAPGATSSSARSRSTAGSSLAPRPRPGHRLRQRLRAGAPLDRRRATPRPPPPGSPHAGSLFVGPWAPELAGDYATGANHVLPTGGLARACGPLAVETFGKFLQVQRADARRPRRASATDDPRARGGRRAARPPRRRRARFTDDR